MSQRGRLFVGLLFLAFSAPLLLIGFGIWEAEPEDLNAPPWVIACAGLAFALAGFSVALSAASPVLDADGSLPESAPVALRALQHGAGVTIVVAMALIPTWIAFGEGDRSIGSSVSAGGLSGAGDDPTTRIVFGVSAVLMWLVVIPFALRARKKLWSRRQ